MKGDAFIDASVFMGMHSSAEATRKACKGFFVQWLFNSVVMSLEHVGRCDELVWRFTRTIQDAYYPFMDSLHTSMRIERRSYEEADLRMTLGSPLLKGLPMYERLLLGMVLNAKGTLYSVSPRLCHRQDLPVRVPSVAVELFFPERLEGLYQKSLMLRVVPGTL
ncbi:MAG: DUF6190 family protein [Egibacteraceae bacterium]